MRYKPELNVQLSDEQYQKVGTDLTEMIQSAETARDALAPRWKQVTAYYNNEPLKDRWWWLKKYKLQPFPLTQPKIDQLCAVLMTSIFSQDRTFVGRMPIGGGRLKPVEDIVQFFLSQGFEDAVDQMAPIACLTNHGAIYIPFEVRNFQYGKEPAGFGYYGIAPGDFVVYPVFSPDLDQALLVGHKKFSTLDQVKHLQDKGWYRQCAVTPGQEPAAFESGMGHEQRSSNTAAQPGHTPVRIECGVAELDLGKGPKRYQYVLAFDTQQILRLDEFPFKHCRYIDLRVKPRQYGGYWSQTSVGQDLQVLQWQYNQLSNLAVAGSYVKAFPWGVTDGKVDKNQELGPMTIANTNGNTTFPQITFDPGIIPFLIQQIERQADAVTRVTQESTGVAISKRQTLGEMRERQTGAQQGLTKFLQAFGNSLARAAQTIQEQLYFHYDVWAGIYRDQAVALGDPEILNQRIDWAPQGKTPDSTGSAIMEKLIFMEQLANNDVQEAMALGYDPTFDIGKVRQNLANITRIPNVEDMFFNPENPSSAMSGIIAGTINQKAEAQAVEMAEQMMESAEGQADIQSQQLEAQFEMELEKQELTADADKHRMEMKSELDGMKAATVIHGLKMQIEGLKAKNAATQAKAQAAKAKKKPDGK